MVRRAIQRASALTANDLKWAWPRRHHRRDGAIRRTARRSSASSPRSRARRHRLGRSGAFRRHPEALVETALGLVVAIPAVWFYNYLTGRIEYFNVEMDNSSSELVDYFIKKTA